MAMPAGPAMRTATLRDRKGASDQVPVPAHVVPKHGTQCSCRSVPYTPIPHKGGKPPVDAKVAVLIEQMAQEKPGWSYEWIQGELLGLSIRVGASTVRRILRRLRIPPAPQRSRTTWRRFLRGQAATMLVCDFFHVNCAVTLRRAHVWSSDLARTRVPVPGN
jgi:hypothetical protein